MGKRHITIGVGRIFPVFLLAAIMFTFVIFAPMIFAEQEKLGVDRNVTAGAYGTEWTGFLNFVVGGVTIGTLLGLGLVALLGIFVSLDILRRVGWI